MKRRHAALLFAIVVLPVAPMPIGWSAAVAGDGAARTNATARLTGLLHND